MNKIGVFHFLLSISSSNSRADEILGDIMETSNGVEPTWRTISEIVVALVWRRACAFVLIPLSTLLAIMFVVQHGLFESPVNPSGLAYIGTSLLIALCLWSVMLQSTVRYGMRDNLSLMTAVFLVLHTLRLVTSANVSNVLIAVFALVCVASRSLRPLLLSAAATASAYIIPFTLFGLWLSYAHVHTPSLVGVAFIMAWVLALSAEGIALTKTRAAISV